MKPFWITTSWDDGHPLDLRIASYLRKYGISGTFYITRQHLRERLSEAKIAQLASEPQFEIGAHTLTHSILTAVDSATARHEVSGSRAWLQSVIGMPITSFCYPRGLYNPRVRDIVSDAGFETARTVATYHSDVGSDPFAMPTTIHIYPFPMRPSSSIRARLQPVRDILKHLPELRPFPCCSAQLAYISSCTT